MYDRTLTRSDLYGSQWSDTSASTLFYIFHGLVLMAAGVYRFRRSSVTAPTSIYLLVDLAPQITTTTPARTKKLTLRKRLARWVHIKLSFNWAFFSNYRRVNSIYQFSNFQSAIKWSCNSFNSKCRWFHATQESFSLKHLILVLMIICEKNCIELLFIKYLRRFITQLLYSLSSAVTASKITSIYQ